MKVDAKMAGVEARELTAVGLSQGGDAIEKQFGKGSIMRLGEDAGLKGIEVIPSGAISLDLALGVGGYPKGRVCEIYGPESSGKTTMALQMARDVYTRRQEGTSVWVVKSSDITASDPGDKGMLFDPMEDKVYRHPTFYAIPDEVGHM